MLKELFQKGKCKIGFHEGEWEYESLEKCLQFRICSICGKRSEKFSHVWDDWEYVYEDQCDQDRFCKRCGEKESRKEHSWGEWRYESGSCRQFRICARCYERETGSSEHLWGQFEYIDSNICSQSQTCKRCGVTNNRINHDWGDWVYSESKESPIRVCRRCGEMQTK